MALTFRPLAKSDFAMFAHWLSQPHVQRWWREPATVEHVAKEYGSCTDGDTTTRVYVVQDEAKPIGIIQSFKLESYPEWAQDFPLPGGISIDYFIGEKDYIGRGIGTQMITQFIATIARPTYPDATGVITSAEVANIASLRALAKAGFEPGNIIVGEYGTPEQVMTRRFLTFM